MTEDTFGQLIKDGAESIQKEFLKNNLKTDPQWWKVRFIDIKKKYNIEHVKLNKRGKDVNFVLNGEKFHYFWDSKVEYWDFITCSGDSESIMFDLIDVGIIDEFGNVNYEIEF